jgi:hypothetical protein
MFDGSVRRRSPYALAERTATRSHQQGHWCAPTRQPVAGVFPAGGGVKDEIGAHLVAQKLGVHALGVSLKVLLGLGDACATSRGRKIAGTPLRRAVRRSEPGFVLWPSRGRPAPCRACTAHAPRQTLSPGGSAGSFQPAAGRLALPGTFPATSTRTRTVAVGLVALVVRLHAAHPPPPPTQDVRGALRPRGEMPEQVTLMPPADAYRVVLGLGHGACACAVVARDRKLIADGHAHRRGAANATDHHMPDTTRYEPGAVSSATISASRVGMARARPSVGSCAAREHSASVGPSSQHLGM